MQQIGHLVCAHPSHFLRCIKIWKCDTSDIFEYVARGDGRLCCVREDILGAYLHVNSFGLATFLPLAEAESWRISIPSGLSEYLELIFEKRMLMFLAGVEQGDFQTESIQWHGTPYPKLFLQGVLHKCK